MTNTHPTLTPAAEFPVRLKPKAGTTITVYRVKVPVAPYASTFAVRDVPASSAYRAVRYVVGQTGEWAWRGAKAFGPGGKRAY